MKNNYKIADIYLKGKKISKSYLNFQICFVKTEQAYPFECFSKSITYFKSKKERKFFKCAYEGIIQYSPIAELKVKVTGRVTYKIPVPVSRERELV
jgi:hypothetical protein